MHIMCSPRYQSILHLFYHSKVKQYVDKLVVSHMEGQLTKNAKHFYTKIISRIHLARSVYATQMY